MAEGHMGQEQIELLFDERGHNMAEGHMGQEQTRPLYAHLTKN